MMNPTIRSKIVFGVAAIMKKIHSKKIIFQNLRLERIYLDDNLEPVIGGFGFCVCVCVISSNASFFNEYRTNEAKREALLLSTRNN